MCVTYCNFTVTALMINYKLIQDQINYTHGKLNMTKKKSFQVHNDVLITRLIECQIMQQIMQAKIK